MDPLAGGGGCGSDDPMDEWFAAAYSTEESEADGDDETKGMNADEVNELDVLDDSLFHPPPEEVDDAPRTNCHSVLLEEPPEMSDGGVSAPADVPGLGAASGSAGGGAPPEPPPAPAAARIPRAEAGPRVPTRLQFFVPGCKLSYYEGSDSIQVDCANPLHGRCTLTRKVRGWARRPAQGRPIGLAVAWCARGLLPDVRTKVDHTRAADMPSREERLRGRAFCKTSELGRHMLAQERAKRAAEPSEPEDCP